MQFLSGRGSFKSNGLPVDGDALEDWEWMALLGLARTHFTFLSEVYTILAYLSISVRISVYFSAVTCKTNAAVHVLL